MNSNLSLKCLFNDKYLNVETNLQQIYFYKHKIALSLVSNSLLSILIKNVKIFIMKKLL